MLPSACTSGKKEVRCGMVVLIAAACDYGGLEPWSVGVRRNILLKRALWLRNV